jgi:hypothetical protein
LFNSGTADTHISQPLAAPRLVRLLFAQNSPISTIFTNEYYAFSTALSNLGILVLLRGTDTASLKYLWKPHSYNAWIEDNTDWSKGNFGYFLVIR